MASALLTRVIGSISQIRKIQKRDYFVYHIISIFFVALNNQRMPSEIGVVKRINGYITAFQLATLDYQSRNKDVSLIDENILNEYEYF